jgi:Tfp pilus assembly protein PilF
MKADELIARLEAMTGLTLGMQGAVRKLERAEWSERLGELATNHIPMGQRPRWSLDPILYSAQPTVRAKAWVERHRRAEAEAAFNEAIAAQPENAMSRMELGRFYAAGSQRERAATEFAQALSLGLLRDLGEYIVADPTIHDDEKRLAYRKVREEIASDILTDRSIGDRVAQMVTNDVFSRLEPAVRARYWAKSGSWEEADTAYHEAVLNANSDNWSICAEYARFLVGRSDIRTAGWYFAAALLHGAPPEALAKDILADRATRDFAFSLVAPDVQGRILDAVFPSLDSQGGETG